MRTGSLKPVALFLLSLALLTSPQLTRPDDFTVQRAELIDDEDERERALADLRRCCAQKRLQHVGRWMPGKVGVFQHQLVGLDDSLLHLVAQLYFGDVHEDEAGSKHEEQHGQGQDNG